VDDLLSFSRRSHIRRRARPRLLGRLDEALVRNFGSRAVGIVLSRGGSGGLRDIKGAGGLTIAQQPVTSAQAATPRSAIGGCGDPATS
jgi:two-component system, chemotaxis family, CheB/CheR fusion protein